MMHYMTLELRDPFMCETKCTFDWLAKIFYYTDKHLILFFKSGKYKNQLRYFSIVLAISIDNYKVLSLIWN